MLRIYRTRRVTLKSQKIKFTLSDKINVFNSILTLVLGALAYYMACLAMRQTDQISKQNQKIQGFDTLLNFSKGQFDKLSGTVTTLNKQLNILNRQLALNENAQKIANRNAKFNAVSSEYKFRVAEQKLKVLVWSPVDHSHKVSEWYPQQREDFVNKARNILESELNNPYLLANPKIATDWINAYDSVEMFVWTSQFLPVNPEQFENNLSKYDEAEAKKNQNEIDQSFRSCVFTVGGLWQKTNTFLARRKIKNKKIISP